MFSYSPSSVSWQLGVVAIVEFVVGATVAKGRGAAYLAIAKETGGLNKKFVHKQMYINKSV